MSFVLGLNVGRPTLPELWVCSADSLVGMLLPPITYLLILACSSIPFLYSVLSLCL
jgi:hypothetical protein